MGHINSNTPEVLRNIDGEGKIKLGRDITAGITVGGIAAGTIVSSNISFAQFVTALLHDDTAMSMVPNGVVWNEDTSTWEIDPAVFSNRELDEDGNPVAPLTLKIAVVPGRDDIEVISVQKIVTRSIDNSDTVSTKTTVTKIPTKKASARTGGANDFYANISFTADDATADEVRIRVSAYEFAIDPAHDTKPTLCPDDKPCGGVPSKVWEQVVTFGEGTPTKAKLTSTTVTPQTDVTPNTDVTFPLVGTVVIGDDGRERTDLTALQILDGTTVLASAADPTTDDVTYDLVIRADASATDRTVSKTLTVLATWSDSTTTEANATFKVIARESTSTTTVSLTSSPTSPQTDITTGTAITFNLTGTVNIGDDGLTRAAMTAFKLVDPATGTVLATAADPTTDDVTYALVITADATATGGKVSKSVKCVAEWGATTKETTQTFEVDALIPTGDGKGWMRLGEDTPAVEEGTLETTYTFNIKTGISIPIGAVHGKDTLASHIVRIKDTTTTVYTSPDPKAIADTTGGGSLSETFTFDITPTAFGETFVELEAVTEWADGTIVVSPTTARPSVTVVPEYKIYAGFIGYPYSMCYGYSVDQGIPAEDFAQGTWPTEAAKAADEGYGGIGRLDGLPYVKTSGNPDEQTVYWTKHKMLPDGTIETTESGGMFTNPIVYTFDSEILKTDPAKVAEVVNNRRPYMIRREVLDATDPAVVTEVTTTGHTISFGDYSYKQLLLNAACEEYTASGERYAEDFYLDPSLWKPTELQVAAIAFPTDIFSSASLIGVFGPYTVWTSDEFEINGIKYKCAIDLGGTSVITADTDLTIKLTKKA